MNRFRFALDPLLRLRRREEDALKRELGTLEQERGRIEALLHRHQQSIVSGKDSMRDALVGRLNVDMLRQQATATFAVDRVARRTAVELAAHAQRTERARAALTEASRRRRAVELLRERKLAEWHAERERQETAFLDELATSASGAPAGWAAPGSRGIDESHEAQGAPQ